MPVAESARPPRNGPTIRHLRSENCEGSTVCANAETEMRRKAIAAIFLYTAVLRSRDFISGTPEGTKQQLELLVIVVFLLRARCRITTGFYGDRGTSEQG